MANRATPLDAPSPPPGPPPPFRHKALAALLAAVGGALGAHRWYLGRRYAWLPLAVTAACLPLLLGVRNWFQTPAFFVAMIPVVTGFVEALVLALMPDARFDARYNATTGRTNRSGWNAVLVAIFSLMIGAIVLMASLALLFQTGFERLRGHGAMATPGTGQVTGALVVPRRAPLYRHGSAVMRVVR
jgi:TM2 domain-containing membrane protein YozV